MVAGVYGELLRVEDLELAFGGSADDAHALSTLVRRGGAQARGGLGAIFQAEAMDGRMVAVKRMIPPDRAAFASEESWQAEVSWRMASFREEYATLCQLAAFKGFVKVYGFGRVGGMPTILMEWVVGVPLAKLVGLPAFEGLRGHARTLVIAQIGRDLLCLLARLESQAESFVHRDISPANVMIRLGSRTLAQQIADGRFELCLIDFGSASAAHEGDGSFTTATRVLRGATPEFAPPEMLSNDVPGLTELRRSSKIDVYAACSVLYWLLCGCTPFSLSERKGEDMHSDYLYKMTHSPQPAGFEPSSVEALLESIVLLGIRPTQDARASAYALYKSLDYFIVHFEENIARAQQGSTMTCLDVRAIDAPRYGDEQIALSNPLASAVMSPQRQASAARQESGGANGVMRPAGEVTRASSRVGSRRFKFVAGALAGIAVVVVLVVGGMTLAGVTLQDEGAMSSSASAEGAMSSPASAEGASAWSGDLVSTSQKYACYGAEGHPLVVTFLGSSSAGKAVFNVGVLYHGHDRSQLVGDISSFATDSYLELDELSGSLSDSAVTLSYSDARVLGANASVDIALKWDGDLAEADTVEATVISHYGNSSTADQYVLSRQGMESR